MSVVFPLDDGVVATLVSNYRNRSFRRLVLLLGAIVALSLTVLIDIMTGPASLSFQQVISVIFKPSASSPQDKVIVWDLRMPIALMPCALARCSVERGQRCKRS